jgi:thiamine-phosphate pyrophosphorylase
VRRFRLRTPLVYLITEGKLTAENFNEESKRVLETIEGAVSFRIPLIQIREKKLPARLVFQLTKEAVRIVKRKFPDSNTKILVNERADVAYLAKAHGVHLPECSVPAEVIRKVFPKDFIIGVSCHDIQACLDSVKSGVDFVTFSPIFSTPNKGQPKGLQTLKEVCEKLKPFPVIALGGINQENYKEVLKIASGFAAIRFFSDRSNLEKLSEILT